MWAPWWHVTTVWAAGERFGRLHEVLGLAVVGILDPHPRLRRLEPAHDGPRVEVAVEPSLIAWRVNSMTTPLYLSGLRHGVGRQENAARF